VSKPDHAPGWELFFFAVGKVFEKFGEKRYRKLRML
jgi:hypothetical protein